MYIDGINQISPASKELLTAESHRIPAQMGDVQWVSQNPFTKTGFILAFKRKLLPVGCLHCAVQLANFQMT